VAIAPTIPLAAPPTNPAARRYNILDAVVGPLDMPDGARLADLAYTVPWCGPGGVTVEPECTGIENDFEGPLHITEGIATVLQRAFTCKAPGKTPADVDRFARGRLEGSEHVLVEATLANRLANSSPVDLGSGTTMIDVISGLEHYAYTLGDTVGAGEPTQGYGLPAVIHMPIEGWAHLAAEDQIIREGGVWRTPLGSIVAPNAGILDSTAYVTGQVVVWRAPSPWLPPAERALDRSTNEYKMLAQRDYVIAWECFTASIGLGPLA
jgi:hypothetical protein